jgi:hypothetical protein
MDTSLQKAVETVKVSQISYCKYITANDAGSTGAHQAGYHVHKNGWPLFFDVPGTKGENKDVFVTIKWQADFETSSRFIYYGVGTRDEYRLTRFGKGFPFLADENVGDLLIICKTGDSYFEAFVLSHDEDIEDFFAALNISSADVNGIIRKQFEQNAEEKLLKCFFSFLSSLKIDFPETSSIAYKARQCYIGSYNTSEAIIKANPDKELLNWINAEFQLFKVIENDRYSSRIKTPFKNVEDLVEIANTILNRRKSRAGKSLEHHLSEIFRIFGLSYQSQITTEDNKKPDFLFPGIKAYQSPGYDPAKLVVLAAKTTCKDRWRQILNEADRIKTKHLFTLQQGISRNQLDEMYKYNVQLVVPKSYLNSFPQEYRPRILTLQGFITHVSSLSS